MEESDNPQSNGDRPDEACALIRYAIDSELSGVEVADDAKPSECMERGIVTSSIDVLLSRLEEEMMETRQARGRAAESGRLLAVERRRADSALAATVELTKKTKDQEKELLECKVRIQELEARLMAAEKDRTALAEKNHALVVSCQENEAKAEALAQILEQTVKADEEAVKKVKSESLLIEVERLTNQVETLLRERVLILSSLQCGISLNPPLDKVALAPPSSVVEEMRRKERVAQALKEYEIQRGAPGSSR
jgi:chromosome segregation ATPase